MKTDISVVISSELLAAGYRIEGLSSFILIISLGRVDAGGEETDAFRIR